MSDHWESKAACKDKHLIMDLPGARGSVIDADLAAIALAICAVCPVLETCKAKAIAHPPNHVCVMGGIVWTRKGKPARQVNFKSKSRSKSRLPLIPCGTATAYRRHLAHGEATCAPCKAAEAAGRNTHVRTRKKQTHVFDSVLVERISQRLTAGDYAGATTLTLKSNIMERRWVSSQLQKKGHARSLVGVACRLNYKDTYQEVAA